MDQKSGAKLFKKMNPSRLKTVILNTDAGVDPFEVECGIDAATKKIYEIKEVTVQISGTLWHTDCPSLPQHLA